MTCLPLVIEILSTTAVGKKRSDHNKTKHRECEKHYGVILLVDSNYNLLYS